MFENIANFKRTDMCGNLTKEDIGREVIVMGFADQVRDLGGLIFINLRDISLWIYLLLIVIIYYFLYTLSLHNISNNYIIQIMMNLNSINHIKKNYLKLEMVILFFSNPIK